MIDYKTVISKEESCSQLITAPLNHKIVLNFIAFNLASGSSRVEVFDGKDKNQRLLGNYTGTKPSFIVQSTGRHMFLVVVDTNPLVISNFTAVYNYTATKGKLYLYSGKERDCKIGHLLPRAFPPERVRETLLLSRRGLVFPLV